MTLLVGDDWRDFFDVVIVQARKPRFFTDESRPIRLFDTDTGVHLWDRVHNLDKGKIYCEVKIGHVHLPVLFFNLEVGAITRILSISWLKFKDFLCIF